MSDSLWPMDCRSLGSSVLGTLQARILEWIAIPFSVRSSWPRDRTQVSCIIGRFFTVWATREAHVLDIFEYKWWICSRIINILCGVVREPWTPDVQAGFRKGRGTRDQVANIHWIIEKARVFQKNIYFCFIDYAKDFDCVDHNKPWKILKEIGIPDHLTCLLRNLYAGQEATVRTGHGTTDWFQIRKGVRQGCILSPCLFNLYAGYIMRNAGLEEYLLFYCRSIIYIQIYLEHGLPWWLRQ